MTLQHVKYVGLEDSSDLEIFRFAKANGFSIVPFDSDFFDLSLIKGQPPKIIWIRTGNLTTDSISKILLKNSKPISEFLQSESGAILEIFSR